MDTSTMFLVMLMMAFLAGGSMVFAIFRSRSPAQYYPVHMVPIESGSNDTGCLLTALLVAIVVALFFYFGLA